MRFKNRLTQFPDLNECNYPGFCDQMCSNFDKGYNCSCKPGYQLVGKGSCKINGK